MRRRGAAKFNCALVVARPPFSNNVEHLSTPRTTTPSLRRPGQGRPPMSFQRSVRARGTAAPAAQATDEGADRRGPGTRRPICMRQPRSHDPNKRLEHLRSWSFLLRQLLCSATLQPLPGQTKVLLAANNPRVGAVAALRPQGTIMGAGLDAARPRYSAPKYSTSCGKTLRCGRRVDRSLSTRRSPCRGGTMPFP